ncbi:hypothetical protein BDZ91DRAFT_769443 [Kalaharituber pfeilii]|nr:hypothetical protein BDZ91DRAFT_769443 [Kalaharituber pfeilii]
MQAPKYVRNSTFIKIYEIVAPHFSVTRFKVQCTMAYHRKFLKELPTRSVRLDIGCSPKNLVDIASKQRHHEAIVADALSLPHPCSLHDLAINIAVYSSFFLKERRVAAIKSIISTPRPITSHDNDYGGKALIYVRAVEQKNSCRRWDKNSKQLTFMPWVMQNKSAEEAYQRYYHLYRQGEI